MPVQSTLSQAMSPELMKQLFEIVEAVKGTPREEIVKKTVDVILAEHSSSIEQSCGDVFCDRNVIKVRHPLIKCLWFKMHIVYDEHYWYHVSATLYESVSNTCSAYKRTIWHEEGLCHTQILRIRADQLQEGTMSITDLFAAFWYNLELHSISFDKKQSIISIDGKDNIWLPIAEIEKLVLNINEDLDADFARTKEEEEARELRFIESCKAKPQSKVSALAYDYCVEEELPVCRPRQTSILSSFQMFAVLLPRIGLFVFLMFLLVVDLCVIFS